MPDLPSNAVIVAVDHAGVIADVLYSTLPGDVRCVTGERFVDLCAPGAAAKAVRFLEQVHARGVARDWELLIGRGSRRVLARFHGAVVSDRMIVVVGTETSGRLMDLYAELLRRDPIRARLFGDLLSVLLEGTAERRPSNHDALEQVSQLNNELATMQRAMAQQNVVLERENQLLGTAAHDLRNPLGVITLGVGRLLADKTTPLRTAARNTLERVAANSEFMNALVNDLLDFSSIESGRLTLERAEFDLSAEVAEAARSSEVLAARKSVRMDSRKCVPLRIVADRRRIRQVLNNLIDNAIKFSPPGATVEVSCDVIGADACVTVIDHGPGIDRETLSRLFTPFGCAGTRGTGGERSTGLGLAIARRIVDAHGGRITVESEPGAGSTFRVELPVH